MYSSSTCDLIHLSRSQASTEIGIIEGNTSKNRQFLTFETLIRGSGLPQQSSNASSFSHYVKDDYSLRSPGRDHQQPTTLSFHGHNYSLSLSDLTDTTRTPRTLETDHNEIIDKKQRIKPSQLFAHNNTKNCLIPAAVAPAAKRFENSTSNATKSFENYPYDASKSITGTENDVSHGTEVTENPAVEYTNGGMNEMFDLKSEDHCSPAQASLKKLFTKTFNDHNQNNNTKSLTGLLPMVVQSSFLPNYSSNIVISMDDKNIVPSNNVIKKLFDINNRDIHATNAETFTKQTIKNFALSPNHMLMHMKSEDKADENFTSKSTESSSCLRLNSTLFDNLQGMAFLNQLTSNLLGSSGSDSGIKMNDETYGNNSLTTCSNPNRLDDDNPITAISTSSKHFNQNWFFNEYQPQTHNNPIATSGTAGGSQKMASTSAANSKLSANDIMKMLGAKPFQPNQPEPTSFSSLPPKTNGSHYNNRYNPPLWQQPRQDPIPAGANPATNHNQNIKNILEILGVITQGGVGFSNNNNNNNNDLITNNGFSSVTNNSANPVNFNTFFGLPNNNIRDNAGTETTENSPKFPILGACSSNNNYKPAKPNNVITEDGGYSGVIGPSDKKNTGIVRFELPSPIVSDDGRRKGERGGLESYLIEKFKTVDRGGSEDQRDALKRWVQTISSKPLPENEILLDKLLNTLLRLLEENGGGHSNPDTGASWSSEAFKFTDLIGTTVAGDSPHPGNQSTTATQFSADPHSDIRENKPRAGNSYYAMPPVPEGGTLSSSSPIHEGRVAPVHARYPRPNVTGTGEFSGPTLKDISRQARHTQCPTEGESSFLSTGSSFASDNELCAILNNLSLKSSSSFSNWSSLSDHTNPTNVTHHSGPANNTNDPTTGFTRYYQKTVGPNNSAPPGPTLPTHRMTANKYTNFMIPTTTYNKQLRPWAVETGEGAFTADNIPEVCRRPVGHELNPHPHGPDSLVTPSTFKTTTCSSGGGPILDQERKLALISSLLNNVRCCNGTGNGSGGAAEVAVIGNGCSSGGKTQQQHHHKYYDNYGSIMNGNNDLSLGGVTGTSKIMSSSSPQHQQHLQPHANHSSSGFEEDGYSSTSPNGYGVRSEGVVTATNTCDHHRHVVIEAGRTGGTGISCSTNREGPDYCVEKVAKLYKNAAAICDATYTWSGQLPPRIYRNPVYSTKIFLGGVPWDITESGLSMTFKNFGDLRIEWPGKETLHPRYPPKGYVYVIFESDKSVKTLLQSCTHDFTNGGDFYYKISSKRMRCKEVQVIPWVISDTNFIRQPSQRLDPCKTVFVGALHGLINAEGLACVMNDLFGGVVYAGVDTDKFKYPIGSGRVTFNNHKSYMKAVSAAFVEVKTPKFAKRLQIDPYLEDAFCNVCKVRAGIYFCRDMLCFKYFCERCWYYHHNNTANNDPASSCLITNTHKPLMRNLKKEEHNVNLMMV